MNWYNLFKIAVYVRDMDIFPEFDAEDEYAYYDLDLQEHITTLHELELKSHYVSQLTDYVDILPERKANIIERLRQIGWRYFVICRDAVLHVFSDWKSKHPIQDADTWAEYIWEDFTREFSTDQEGIRYIMDQLEGISIGDPNWGISIDKNDIAASVDPDTIKSVIHEDFWTNYEYYEPQIEQFLEDKYDDEYYGSDMEPIDFMEEHDLEEEALEYIYETTDMESFIVDYEAYNLIDRWDIMRAIRDKLYPIYMANFGGSLEEVYENINKAEQRLNSVGPQDSISKMTIAVSLSLNVMHVFGNILTDYGEGLITQDYLDWLAEGEQAAEWEQEAKDEYIVGR